MIRTLRLGNFKAFAETQTIPIRPLTLIFGPNSAGKSSIIHSLALAHHAMRTGKLDTHRTQIGGDSIDLGGFHQYVHRRDDSRRVEWTVELDTKSIQGRLADLLASARTVAFQLLIGARHGAEASVQVCNLLIDGDPVVTMSARADGRFRIDRLEQSHRIFREIIHGIVLMGTTTEVLSQEDIGRVDSLIDELVPQIPVTVERLFPTLERWESQEEELAQSLLMPIGKGTRGDDLRAAVSAYFPRVLRELIDGASGLVEQTLERFRYLGPLRSYPPRHLAFSSDHDSNWSAGGGEAWDVLRKREDVRSKVNAWLSSERLTTPYHVTVRSLMAPHEADFELLDAIQGIHDLLTGATDAPRGQFDLGTDGEIATDGEIGTDYIDAVETIYTWRPGDEGDDDPLHRWDPDVFLERIREGLNRAAAVENLSEVVLTDQRTGTVVSHRDVGIGVSQVLPVLVNAFSMEGRLIAIEQPEIHLHPGLQAELGDVFIESALGASRNTFLLETHSEHLILRLMRRMRQTADGELPAGLPAVRPEDVAILYVEPREKASSIVRHLELDREGKLLDAWPGGFFEEGFRERFED